MDTQKPPLLHAKLDPWVLGGGSILFFFLFFLISKSRPSFVFPAAVALVVQNCFVLPHFTASYHLAYSRGLAFVKRHWVILIVLPVVMVISMFWIKLQFAEILGHPRQVDWFNQLMDKIGLGLRLSPDEKVGELLISAGYLFMFSTVGWHYSKQVYGTVIISSLHEKYKFSDRQRWLLKQSLLGAWWLALVRVNLGVAAEPQMGFPVRYLGLPPFMLTFSYIIFGILMVFTVWEVWIKNYLETRQQAPWRVFLPWLAFFIWWLPERIPDEWRITFVPLFHAVQYLSFYGSFELSKVSRFKLAYYFLVLAAIAYILFDYSPDYLDQHFGVIVSGATLLYFGAISTVYLNTHHYLVDGILWKLSDPELRTALLKK
jgi:hypothetical protein